MRIVDRGGGTPIVVIPGVQGRWEWMKPGINALAQRARVVTFSLADEPSCRGSFDAQRGFECYVDQVRDALDAAGIERAAICGMSYGGLIAAGFAVRYPERTAALVMVSAVPPSWRPDRRVRFYLRAPRALMPLFLLASLRMYREIAADQRRCIEARPDLPEARRRMGEQLAEMYAIEADMREAVLDRPRSEWIGPLWRGLQHPGLRRKSLERAFKLVLPRRLFGIGPVFALKRHNRLAVCHGSPSVLRAPLSFSRRSVS